MDSPDPPPDRLSDEEIHFVRPGESSEIKAWNRDYALLVAEYLTALDGQDEGYAGERVAEIRKCRDGLLRKDIAVVDAARQEVRHRRLEDRQQW
jgi:hypothetical protein